MQKADSKSKDKDVGRLRLSSEDPVLLVKNGRHGAYHTIYKTRLKGQSKTVMPD